MNGSVRTVSRQHPSSPSQRTPWLVIARSVSLHRWMYVTMISRPFPATNAYLRTTYPNPSARTNSSKQSCAAPPSAAVAAQCTTTQASLATQHPRTSPVSASRAGRTTAAPLHHKAASPAPARSAHSSKPAASQNAEAERKAQTCWRWIRRIMAVSREYVPCPLVCE